MPSSRRVKKLNKAWKSFTKTSQRIAGLFSSLSLSNDRENRLSIPSYSTITSLYDCPCSFRCTLCKQLRLEPATRSRDSLPEDPVMLHDKPYTMLHDKTYAKEPAMLHDKPYAEEPVMLHDKPYAKEPAMLHDKPYAETEEEDAEMDDENVGETGTQFPDSASALAQEADGKENRLIKHSKEVDQRAELYIKHFWDEQKHQRQRSIEEFYDMLARSI